MTCADRYLHKLFSSLCRSLFYFPADIIINDACLQNIEHFHLIISFKEFEEAVFKLAYFIQRYILQQAMRAAIKDCNLLFHRHRSVLRLYQQTGVLLPLVDSQCSYRSMSPLNLVNASSSRYCAWSIFNVPATFFIALI